MKKTLAIFALCALAAQAYAGPHLETGAVVCWGVNLVRTAHVASLAAAHQAKLPRQCIKTIHPVALNAASEIGQLARITVHQNGSPTRMWTLQAYVRH